MKFGCVIVVTGVLLAGCGTNREYKSAELSSDRAYKKGKASPQLRENEVLGLNSATGVSDNDIKRILDEASTLNLKTGSTVLLVQSGSQNPDNEMVQQLSQHFTVVPHSGVPAELRGDNGDVSKALRLAAAHAKAENIIVYWGNVEMKRDDLPTGLVSWVPVVDFMVPDEYQKVRMHLKVALIDVRSGQWATFRTEAIEDETLTTRYAREKTPDWPLKGIKERVYASTVQKLVNSYVVARN